MLLGLELALLYTQISISKSIRIELDAGVVRIVDLILLIPGVNKMILHHPQLLIKLIWTGECGVTSDFAYIACGQVYDCFCFHSRRTRIP